MKIYIEKENKNIEIKFNGNINLILKKLKINPETVIITKNNELISENEKLKDKDSIKILSVVSGG